MTQEKYTRSLITAVRNWVPGKLFSLRLTRDAAFQFTAGQFARLGLAGPDSADGQPTLWRAYSMVSAPTDPYLEFYSVVVPQGAFSPLLAGLTVGDPVYVDKTAFGFLTTERLTPGGDLWLIGTGTGLGPYLSLLGTASTWASFERIFVVHGVRTAGELAYRDELEHWRQTWPQAANTDDRRQLVYLPVASRESLPGMPQARLTTLLADGRLEQLAGAALDPERARVMLCGNPEMLAQARQLLAARGFAPGRRGALGNLAVENYW